MAPSRRRGPSGKTFVVAARSAAIQAAERRRQEEQKEHESDQSKKNNDDEDDDDNDDNRTSTAKSFDVGYETRIILESTNNNNNNNITAVDPQAEAGKKRKKFSFIPQFASDVGTATTTSTASSSPSPAQGVVVTDTTTTSNQLLNSQPYCKIVPEDPHHKSICSQRSKIGKMIYRRKQELDYLEAGDIGDEDDDDDDEDEGCLHCHEKVKNMPRIFVINDDDDNDDNNNDNDSDEGFSKDCNIQVRCDDCRGYICNGCHWCHEFQANHEIRVCDRCDAFYCRGCDEMDQCDDCGEVVCGSCSTLLSCKFCGGGLCEECATACGRCGIVLCSRDAKFAVDCDTCRLSYCLVCLASGGKDPCVRCGHRPSKRMEQLVHLRLKSIYKAFKNSNSNNRAVGSSSGGDEDDHQDKINTISSHDSLRCNNPNTQKSNSNKDGNSGRSRRNKPTTLQDMVGDNDDENSGSVDPAVNIMMGAAAGVLPQKFCHDLQQNYLAEQRKADAAAEALLAELEEEETAMAQKKSKKKKKKERKNASKQNQSAAKDNLDVTNDKDGSDTEKEKSSTGDKAILDSSDDEVNADSMSDVDTIHRAAKADDETDQNLQKVQDINVDPVEKELVTCVNNIDLEGIENILFRLKGVPGRAALRKNAKKALKRLKLELRPRQPTTLPEPRAELPSKTERKSMAASNQSSSAIGNVAPIGSESRTSSKKAAMKSERSSYNGTKPSYPKSSFHKSNGSNRIEAHVEIVSRLVGWMIGKNGQRIRDLMEESGAKIWIDQEKFKGQETRNVYISGDRKSVDHAVLLVNDVITNAPPPQGTTNTTASAPASMSNTAITQQPLEVSGKRAGSVSQPPTTSSKHVIPDAPEVKSAWSNLRDTPQPIPLGKVVGVEVTSEMMSSSTSPVAAEKAKKRSKAKLTAETQMIEPVKEKEAPVTLLSLTKDQLDTTTPATDALSRPNLQQTAADVTTEIVTCDFRFVPLLIGKRGWAIKNIQDNSGARVDIDQTVTPRQVRISGSKENVDKAVTMVRDVLSYPHAQLQSTVEGMANDVNAVPPGLGPNIPLSEAPLLMSLPTNHNLLGASAVLEHGVTRNAMQRDGENSDRIHSPPPLVGDAKSAISASSSLSSTPEPSMASSSKGFIPSHLQNGPLFPPPGEHYAMGNPAPQAIPRQFLQSEGGLIEGTDTGRLWASAGMVPRATIITQPSYADPSGQINFPSGEPISVQHVVPSHPQAQQLQHSQHRQVTSSLLHEQLLSQVNTHHQPHHSVQQSFPSTGQISTRMSLQNNPNGSPINRSSQFHNQNIGNDQQPPYHLYSNETVPAARAIATTPLRDLMHHAGVGPGTGTSSHTREPGFVDNGNRLWNQAFSSSGLRSQPAGLQPSTSSGFAAPSIGYNLGQSNEADITDSFGYTNSQAIPSQQHLRNTEASTFSNSQMIDNLFGGAVHAPSSNNVNSTNELLTGFNGLSLQASGDYSKPSGLWGSSNLTETWHDEKANMMNENGPPVSSIDNIFSNEFPDPSSDHPQESRFHWD